MTTSPTICKQETSNEQPAPASAAEARNMAEIARLARNTWLEEAAKMVESLKDYYPESVFIPPLSGQHGQTVDACSAAAIRAILPVIASDIRKLKDHG